MNCISHAESEFAVAVEPCPPLNVLEARWRELEERSDGSFFTSWTWIGAWLSTHGPSGARPELRLVTAYDGTLVIGLALIGTRRDSSPFRRRRIGVLNQSGEPADDCIYIEYNDALLDRRCAGSARRAMLRHLLERARPWRGIALNAVTPAVAIAVGASSVPHHMIIERVCPWIDLERVPAGLEGYLSVLSRNTRQQVQRCLRLYQKDGELNLRVARNAAEARAMLEELAALHERAWHARKGHVGAFASARFKRFAESVVAAGAAEGHVQLLRASAGATPIGYLLNFVHRGHAFAYQSGFEYRDDNRFHPGLVTHALAAVRAREQGLRGYHFMAGEGRYKSSLSNAEERLFWITLRHEDVLTRAEDAARGLKRRILGLLRR